MDFYPWYIKTTKNYYGSSEDLWLAFLEDMRLTSLSLDELRMYIEFVSDEFRLYRGDFVHDLAYIRMKSNTKVYWKLYKCGSYIGDKEAVSSVERKLPYWELSINEDGYVEGMCTISTD